MAAMPRKRVSRPKALVSFSSPSRSHKMMEDREMKAAEKDQAKIREHCQVKQAAKSHLHNATLIFIIED